MDEPKRSWRRWIWILLRPLSQFSLASYMWFTLLMAVLVLWYMDRVQLKEQISKLTGGSRGASWSIDQICGAPDTNRYGDVSTAWASMNPDGREEWVIVEFPRAVNATGANIYETYNPGAVVSVSSVAMDRSEQLLWSGTDPLKGTAAVGIAKITFEPVRTRRLKIVIDSAAFPGWNELDAVGLVDDDGQVQWASRGWASSSFGENRDAPQWYWP